MKIRSVKPLAAAIGASLLASTLAPKVAAGNSPFALNEIKSGYQVAEGDAAKPAEGKCGEGKCGDKKAKTEAEGNCCDKAGAEGNCGDMSKPEGKCGEGKCGDKKPAAATGG